MVRPKLMRPVRAFVRALLFSGCVSLFACTGPASRSNGPAPQRGVDYTFNWFDDPANNRIVVRLEALGDRAICT
jgi:hypothetical protein